MRTVLVLLKTSNTYKVQDFTHQSIGYSGEGDTACLLLNLLKTFLTYNVRTVHGYWIINYP